MLALAGFGEIVEEVRDPLHLVSSAYDNMYGFIPKEYRRSNFYQMMKRSLKTGDIELVVKNTEQYIRLTSAGKAKYKRDFSVAKLTKKWNKKWVILTFDIEEKQRRTRDKLRNKLKNIGFGMLQESVWISPLPIGEEVLELMETFELSDNTFVLESSHLLMGNPLDLARRVWHLDTFEEACNEIITKLHDRDPNRRGEKLRTFRKQGLELLISLPLLPEELLPDCVSDLRKILL